MLNDEELQLLRESTRGLLARHWPAEQAVEWSRERKELERIRALLAEQGLLSLGVDPDAGGLRAVTCVMEELGHAGCPAPVMGAVLAGLALSGTDADEVMTLVDALQEGKASVAFAFGHLDLDPGARGARLEDDSVTGTVRCVEGLEAATHLLVVCKPDSRLALLRADGRGVKVTTQPGLAMPPLADVSLEGAPVMWSGPVPQGESGAKDLNRIARLCLVSRALGAATRSFEMAVDYAKERRQFGRPIGSFQAVQHKLADCLMDLEGTRSVVAGAAAGHDGGSSDWRLSASAAYGYGSVALRRASLETHHAFGAIGYAEEHEAPRHFKRVHGDLYRHGGPGRAREELAAHLLEGNGTLPEHDLGEAGNAFRTEVRQWLRDHWTEERRREFASRPLLERTYHKDFNRELGATGWIGCGWPKEFGGQDRTPFEQFAFLEEMDRAEAPKAGAPIVSAPIMRFGTPQQQKKYLPEILSGEALVGIAYSEPDTGSDLASLRTSAVRDGDHWVINGQKIWNSTWFGTYYWLAVRTDPDATPRHAGISVIMVPTDTPGISVHPQEFMFGSSFGVIHFDNVRVPADAMIGEVNTGWKVITGALATERMVMGGVITAVTHTFELLLEQIRGSTRNGRPLMEDAVVRARVGELAAEIEVGRQLLIRCVAMVEDGATPMEHAAMAKAYSGELMERLGEASMDLLGMQATLSRGAAGAIADGKLEKELRHSMMYVISGGTAEIQRNLIAKYGLGLHKLQ